MKGRNNYNNWRKMVLNHRGKLPDNTLNPVKEEPL